MINLLKLANLVAGQPIVSQSGAPSTNFMRQINNSNQNIASVLNALIKAQNAADTAQATASSASQTANTATTSLTSLSSSQDALTASLTTLQGSSALTGSYCDPNAILTATPISISVAAHTRRYLDGTTASLAAGTITGLTPEVRYFVYYNDPARAGGSPTYQVSTSLIGEAGSRHICGWIVTALLKGAATAGHTAMPPGIVPFG